MKIAYILLFVVPACFAATKDTQLETQKAYAASYIDCLKNLSAIYKGQSDNTYISKDASLNSVVRTVCEVPLKKIYGIKD